MTSFARSRTCCGRRPRYVTGEAMRLNNDVMIAAVSLLSRGGMVICQHWPSLDLYEKIFMLRAVSTAIRGGLIEMPPLPSSPEFFSALVKKMMQEEKVRLSWTQNGPSAEGSNDGEDWRTIYREAATEFWN